MVEHAGEQHSQHDGADAHRERGGDTTRPNDGESGAQGISPDDIRNRAHEIYLSRGGAEGDPVADWLEAEREVQGRSSAKRTPDDLTTSRE